MKHRLILTATVALGATCWITAAVAPVWAQAPGSAAPYGSGYAPAPVAYPPTGAPPYGPPPGYPTGAVPQYPVPNQISAEAAPYSAAPFQAPPGTQLYTSPNVGPLVPSEVSAPQGPHAAGAVVPGQTPARGAQLVHEATIVANVNGEAIMASEVLRPLNLFMTQRRAEIPDGQVNEVRRQLAQSRLSELIEQKLIYQEAMATIPESNHKMINDRFDEQFSETEIKRLMTEANVSSPAQLDTFLRQQGDSLERTKRRYREQMLARQWMFRETHDESEITHEDMLAYYYENAQKYEREATVEWLQLTVRFDRVDSRQQAYEQIAWMGNQVMQGADWGEIARAYSSGPTASEGGRRTPTTQGSLVSEVLDQALFGLPVDGMSPILMDSQGYHIVKVLERAPAGRVPFTDVQDEIIEKIREKRRAQLREKYLAKLKENRKVWTIFDEPEGDDFFAERPNHPLIR